MNDQPAGAAIGPLDIKRVMAALPHRYPMLLVDRVESLDPEKGIVAIKAVTRTAHTSTNFASSPGFKELFLGNSPKPRLSIGIGANWTSPFGPLRLDLAKALLKQKGDDTKLFTFNVGTQF